MRMFRLPAWISESRGCDKVVDDEVDLKMAHTVTHLIPGVIKRQRNASEEAQDSCDLDFPDSKRRKVRLDDDAGLDGSKSCPLREVRTSERLRDTIETQFNLEILLKHNELRLINQELAKCQVALEQLRRCSLIPFPTTQNTPESMLHVSNGTGSAVASGVSVPQWAPSYGVVDGPYTRHYAKWLIPDPSFDVETPDWPRALDPSRPSKIITEGRFTRNSSGDLSTPVNKIRGQRGSADHKLQALSSGYLQVKEKAGPCILKRQDGQMVKLVCIDCQRDNFSSTQGFINHCRIAHRRDFKTHEEAAVASGQAIEVDEIGGIVGEEKAPPSATGLVHPLIRNAPTDRDAYAALLSRIDASMALFKQGKLPGVTVIPSSTPSTAKKLTKTPKAHQDFVATPDTPHLSALLQNRGVGLNLSDLVTDAKAQIDFDDLSGAEDDVEDSGKSLEVPLSRADRAGAMTAMRIPARVTMSSAPLSRPSSSKGLDTTNVQQPATSKGSSGRTTSVANGHRSVPHPIVVNDCDAEFEASPEVEGDDDMDPMNHSYDDLSPNTILSNNAPSLVSDDGEYEDGDDDGDESSHSGMESEGSISDVAIEDEPPLHPRNGIRRHAGNNGIRRLRKEEKENEREKHVTFVHPVKEIRKVREVRTTGHSRRVSQG